MFFFLFFFIIDLYFSFLAVSPPIYNPTVEFAIPIRITTNEAKAEIETQLVMAETKINKCSIVIYNLLLHLFFLIESLNICFFPSYFSLK